MFFIYYYFLSLYLFIGTLNTEKNILHVMTVTCNTCFNGKLSSVKNIKCDSQPKMDVSSTKTTITKYPAF